MALVMEAFVLALCMKNNEIWINQYVFFININFLNYMFIQYYLEVQMISIVFAHEK
jgi:hypothetical protein